MKKKLSCYLIGCCPSIRSCLILRPFIQIKNKILSLPYFLFFQSYLENRFFVTKINFKISQFTPILTGVFLKELFSLLSYLIYIKQTNQFLSIHQLKNWLTITLSKPYKMTHMLNCIYKSIKTLHHSSILNVKYVLTTKNPHI